MRRYFQRNRSQSRGGQLVVEAIVALSVLSMGLIGMIALLNRSLHLNRVIADNYIGSYLAAEGIEVVKNLVDANVIRKSADPGVSWLEGIPEGDLEVEHESAALLPSTDRQLRFDFATGLYSYSGSQPTTFIRKIRITYVVSPVTGDTDEIRVRSLVTWRTGSGQFRSELEDHFFNWRPTF